MSTFQAAIFQATKEYDRRRKCDVPLLSLVDDDGQTHTVQLKDMGEIVRKDLHLYDLVLVEKADDGSLHLVKAYPGNRLPDAQALVCEDAE